MKSIRAFLIIGLSVCYLGVHGNAQRSEVHQDPEATFRHARNLFDLEQYSAAQAIFTRFTESSFPGVSEEALASAHYYRAACAAYLFHSDARHLLTRFVAKYPQSPQVVQAWFQLGRISFRDRDYHEVIRNFEQADEFLLMGEEQPEFFFKKGYSQYMVGLGTPALLSFERALAQESVYTNSAHYYSGQIYFEAENYSKALEHFMKVKGDRTFSRVIPFYILQIHYNLKQYAEALAYGGPVADTLKGQQRPRVIRLVAESAYQLGNYAKAITYFEMFSRQFGALDREGNYRFGMAYYKNKQFREAADFLRRATSEDDAMAQSAYYYLAEIFVEMGSKRLALDALRLAASKSHDPELSRDALFNFAKLSYELGLNPYNEAVEALEEFLRRFPKASNVHEAQELMVQIYMSARNYRDALVSLEKMPSKSTRLEQAYQRILYFRGLELFNNLELEAAKTHFNKAIASNFDPAITAESRYWLGETLFKQGSYNGAQTEWEKFLATPTARSFEHYHQAWYNLGYARLKQKDYEGAIREFRAFLERPGASKSTEQKVQDARLRLGDAYFMQKNFQRALQFYTEASRGSSQADYALLQKGILEGLTGNHDLKFETLSSLRARFPQSPYREEAAFEAGRALVRQGQSDRAQREFESFLTAFPKSVFVPRAYLELGLLHYNREQDEPALDWFKRITQEYPQTAQNGEAVRYIQTIYTNSGRVDDWLAFAREQGNLGMNQSNLDSGAYAAVLSSIQSSDCERIIRSSEAYLSNFPTGLFRWQATHHLAECLFDAKQDSRALTLYNSLAESGLNDFRENAALKAGFLAVQAEDWESAIRRYLQLEEWAGSTDNLLRARENLMRAYMNTRQWESAIVYARKVLTFEKLTPGLEREANLSLLRAYYSLNDDENVLATSRVLVKKVPGTDAFAEAAFRMGEVLFRMGDAKQAERELRANIRQMGSSREWLARSFILLSDVYVALDDLMQAKSALQTVIDRHEGEELRNVAREKLAVIEATERDKTRRQFEESMEFDLND
jgi:TolA-binding protein